MEEVWKDINLSSLNEHPSIPASPNSNFRSMILQDFLARPFSRDQSRPTSIVTSASETANSLYVPPSTPPPPPATVLSLRESEFQFGPLRPGNSQLVQPHHSVSNVSSILSDPFENFACPSGFPSLGNKRSNDSDSSSGDRRHKRMIKNRESAARSRARKQAYTNELEQKVQYLTDENARLRRQHQQICKAAATQVKSTLCRTSTAPF
ncbi:hypothetical protein L6164_027603 [Bauhinia variegata]|uniref:Uncharacterized protein n=1 Tax=Bauhinia variegata TaxID=167791 RepID=A0ACB9LTW5_BAUVA|nr:hypothetical protein L6164_027603 [Bauhinia variegata]